MSATAISPCLSFLNFAYLTKCFLHVYAISYIAMFRIFSNFLVYVYYTCWEAQLEGCIKDASMEGDVEGSAV